MIGCANGSYRLQKWKAAACEIHNVPHQSAECVCQPPFGLHPLPTRKKKPEQREMFKRLLNRVDPRDGRQRLHSPSKDGRICSVHFRDGRPTPENPFPTEELGYAGYREMVARVLMNEPSPSCAADRTSVGPSARKKSKRKKLARDLSPEPVTRATLEDMETEPMVDQRYMYLSPESVISATLEDIKTEQMGDQRYSSPEPVTSATLEDMKTEPIGDQWFSSPESATSTILEDMKTEPMGDRRYLSPEPMIRATLEVMKTEPMDDQHYLSSVGSIGCQESAGVDKLCNLVLALCIVLLYVTQHARYMYKRYAHSIVAIVKLSKEINQLKKRVEGLDKENQVLKQQIQGMIKEEDNT